MTPPSGYTEDVLIEQPAIALLAALGWQTVGAYHEFDHGASSLGRETKDEVALKTRLREALLRLNAEASPENHAQAESSKHLRQLLSEDHRYVFTLIHKFLTEQGEMHPVLSDRRDIIVITDEAHRSQYDTLALNMRTALPNAAFLAFTGTPLIVGEEKTRQVFGDYVNVYDFRQSVADGATVPLYYENRIPELQLVNDNLNEDMENLLEAAELDEEQGKKLERKSAREYHLITRDDRLEAVAKDLVAHFTGRNFQGKAMMICIDKATAIRMYDKVKKYWSEKIAALQAEAAGVEGGNKPVEDKSALVAALRQALAETRGLCQEHGVNLAAIQAAEGFARVGLLNDAVEAPAAAFMQRREGLFA